MSDDVLIRVDGAYKKFCRSLKKSLWYGLKDTVADLTKTSRSDLLRSKEFWAVEDVSFELRRGECLALIGRNGSGKTTLLKMLNGLIKPDAGHIELRGRVAALIALGAGFNPVLTGRENIYINGSVLGLSRSEIDQRLNDIVEFAEIGDFLDTPVRSYSSGMHVRLGFAVTTALEPDILLVDEVLAVGDARFRWKCLQRLKSLKERGLSIILVSHNAADQLRTCNRGLVLRDGRKVCDAGIDEALLSYNGLTSNGPGDHQDKGQVVHICRFDFLVNGVISNQMKQGDELEIEIQLNSSECLAEVRFVISFYHAEYGMLFALSSYRDEGWIEVPKGQSVVRLALADLPLQFGCYHASVSIRGPELHDIYCERQSDSTLSILSPQPDYDGFGMNGVITPQAAWKFTTQKSTS